MADERFGRVQAKRGSCCTLCGRGYRKDDWIAFDNWKSEITPVCLVCANNEIDSGNGTWKNSPKGKAPELTEASQSAFRSLSENTPQGGVVSINEGRYIAMLRDLEEKTLLTIQAMSSCINEQRQISISLQERIEELEAEVAQYRKPHLYPVDNES